MSSYEIVIRLGRPFDIHVTTVQGGAFLAGMPGDHGPVR